MVTIALFMMTFQVNVMKMTKEILCQVKCVAPVKVVQSPEVDTSPEAVQTPEAVQCLTKDKMFV